MNIYICRQVYIYILNIVDIYIYYMYTYLQTEVREDFQFDRGVSIFCVLHVWHCSNPSRCRLCIDLSKIIDINTSIEMTEVNKDRSSRVTT